MTAPMVASSASLVKIFCFALYRRGFSPLTVRILSDSELSAACAFRALVVCPPHSVISVSVYPFRPPMAFDHSTLSDRSFAPLG